MYLQTLYVTSLLRIGGALFLNACKRCSVTSSEAKDLTKSTDCLSTGLLIRPGTRWSSGGYSVVNHPLLWLDYQLTLTRLVLSLL